MNNNIDNIPEHHDTPSSFNSHKNPSSNPITHSEDVLSTQDLVLSPIGETDFSFWLPSNFKSSLFDQILVPCTPRHRLPGLAFISSKAESEFEHGARGDELLPGDIIEIQFNYAQILHDEGQVSIKFPTFYNDAYELKENALSKTVGIDCPFFFELGEKLCEIIPDYEWPVIDLMKILITARNQRFLYLQLKKHNADASFTNGMTYKERKMYNKLVEYTNPILKGKKGSISLDSFLDSLDYFNK